MVRNNLRKITLTLHKSEVSILWYIGTAPAYEIIRQINVAEALEIPNTSLNHHFTKLKHRGLIDQINQLTAKGKKFLRYLKHWDKSFEKKLRAHKIQVTLFLAKPVEDFGKVKNCILTPFTNKRYSGLKTELNGCKVMFYSKKKVVVKLPDVLANNDEEIVSAIDDVLGQLIEALELEFEGLVVDSYKICEFSSMHIAVLDSVIAEAFMLKNGRCYSDGRFAIDGSHGGSELEVERVDTALEDIKVLVEWEEMARENERLKKEMCELESQLADFRNNVD